MSLFQSWLQRLRDRQFDLTQLRQAVQSRNWLNASLGLGIGIGLMLGLWIGWGIWPVTWTGASLRDLRADARADYMSAVADAYALSSTPEGAAVAQQRLSLLGNSDLAQEFAAATVYYRNSTVFDKPARINNLSRLASALGIQSPGVAEANQTTIASNGAAPTINAGATNAGADSTTTSNSNTASSSGAVPSSGSSWLNWLLGLLTAMMIIAGVFYLYLLIRPPRPRYQTATYGGEPLNDATIDARFDEMGDATLRRRAQMYGTEEPEDDFAQAGGSQGQVEPTPGYGNTSSVSLRKASNDASIYQRPKIDDYEFDPELDEHPPTQHFAANQPTARVQVWPQSQGKPEPEGAEDQAATDTDDDLINDVDEVDKAKNLPGAPTAISPSPEPPRDNAPEAAPAASPPGPRAGLTGRASKLKLLEKYSAHYQAGIPNYEEKHPILDPGTNRYIGEMGVGVSTKNALFQNDPAQAIALEVWLFDKADDRNMGSPTRILLSEYAIDHNLEQAFLKERQDDQRPIIAQPDVQFQLEGHSLVLDCVITEATYVKNGQNRGIFQSVKVDLTVLQKV